MSNEFINWLVEKSDVVQRLRAELAAAVEYHAFYTRKIDKALEQPRGKDDLLTKHLREIYRLQKRVKDLENLGCQK